MQDVSECLAYDLLEKDLRKLKILGISIGNYETTLHNLCSVYGQRAGIYYSGLLMARKNCPSWDRVSYSAMLHHKTLHNQLKKVVDAGVAQQSPN